MLLPLGCASDESRQVGIHRVLGNRYWDDQPSVTTQVWHGITAEQKSLIERAAALQGRSVTDFVLTSVQDAARRAIEEHSQLALSVRDSEAFVDALLNPWPVNYRLRDTVRRYRERAGV